MKLFLKFLTAILLTAGFTFGQGGISIGGNIALPVGDWSDGVNLGFGGTASYETPLGKTLDGTITAGYIVFGTESDAVDFSMIPILAGAKFFVSPNGIYVHAQAGLQLVKSTVELPTILGFGGGTVSETSTEFSVGGSVGYEVPVGGKNAVDLSAGYYYVSDANYLGFRVAYKFGI